MMTNQAPLPFQNHGRGIRPAIGHPPKVSQAGHSVPYSVPAVALDRHAATKKPWNLAKADDGGGRRALRHHDAGVGHLEARGGALRGLARRREAGGVRELTAPIRSETMGFDRGLPSLHG